MRNRQIRNIAGYMMRKLDWTSAQRDAWLARHDYRGPSSWSNWLYGYSRPCATTVLAMERELGIPRTAWTAPYVEGLEPRRPVLPRLPLVDRVEPSPVVEHAGPAPDEHEDLQAIDELLARAFSGAGEDDERRVIDEFLDKTLEEPRKGSEVELEAHLGAPVVAEPTSYAGTRVRSTWLRPFGPTDIQRVWAA